MDNNNMQTNTQEVGATKSESQLHAQNVHTSTNNLPNHNAIVGGDIQQQRSSQQLDSLANIQPYPMPKNDISVIGNQSMNFDQDQKQGQHFSGNQQVVPNQQYPHGPETSKVQLSTEKVDISSQPSQPTIVTMPPTIKPLLESETTESGNYPQVPPSSQTPGLSPQKTSITKVKLSDGLNVFDWLRTADIINQIAEKARSSVDSVITILDPGMKEYLYSGGNINIMVVSHNSPLVSPLRDAFQSVFGRATVIPTPANSKSIDYPIKLSVGFEQTIVVAKERIRQLRTDTNNVPQNQVIAVIQPSLVNISKDSTFNSVTNGSTRQDNEIIPRWFLTYCILIEDPVLNLTINSLSQFIPIDDDLIARATKESIYPNDFNDKHLGFATTIDQLMLSKLQMTEAEASGNDYGCCWLPKWSGNYETQIIHQTGLALANEYRRRWSDCVQIETLS